MEENQETMISLKDIVKKYKNKEVLKGVSFSVNRGDIFAFIGPNGVGKSTTIKAITGLLKIDSGEVLIKDGQRIGLIVDQNCLYSCFTAKENMEYYLRLFDLYNEDIINKYLSIVGLLSEKNTAVYKFSKGMKRRLVIARILAMEPNILIMDEPLDGLDVSSQLIIIRLLKEWVKNGERCIIYTSHDMAEVESLCNKVGFIRNGMIILQGTLNEILKDEICSLRIVPRDNEIDVLNKISSICPYYRKNEEELFFEVDKEKMEIIDLLFDNNIRVKEFNYIYRSLAEIYERMNKYDSNN